MAKRYEDVKSAIRARIAAGVYARGARIPASSDLTREFDVSSITIRRALRDLEVEGLLYGHQGLGVFVSDRTRISRSLNPPYVTSLGDQMRLAGVEPGIRDLSYALVVPEADVLATLRLAPESLVYKHEKVVLADGRPVGFDVTFVPRPLGEQLRSEMGSDFVMPLLEKHRVAYKAVQYRLEACSLTDREAAVLESPIGSPLLSISYSPIDPDGRPILLGHMVTRAEWFSFDFRVDHPGPQSAAAGKQSVFEHQG